MKHLIWILILIAQISEAQSYLKVYEDAPPFNTWYWGMGGICDDTLSTNSFVQCGYLQSSDNNYSIDVQFLSKHSTQTGFVDWTKT